MFDVTSMHSFIVFALWCWCILILLWKEDIYLSSKLYKVNCNQNWCMFSETRKEGGSTAGKVAIYRSTWILLFKMMLTKMSVSQVLVRLNYALRGQRTTCYLIRYILLRMQKLLYTTTFLEKKRTYALMFDTAEMYR